MRGLRPLQGFKPPGRGGQLTNAQCQYLFETDMLHCICT